MARPDEEAPAPRALPAIAARGRAGLDTESVLTYGGASLILAGIVGFFLIASRTDADTWVPIGVLCCLTIITIPICHYASGRSRDSRLFKLLLMAFFLKMLFVGPRYALNEVFYKGEVDAARYDQAGDYFLQNMSEGRWSIEGSELDAFPKETRIVGYFTGLLYIVFGTSYVGGYFVFSWISWVGLLCFFKAFRLAQPNAPPYLAAKLLFLLPSLLFWPSSLGKEALMVFLIGLITLGVARLLTRSGMGLGLLYMAMGGMAVYEIRPHLLLISAVALAATTLTSTRSQHSTRGAILFRILMLLLLVPVLVSGLGRIDTMLGTTGGGTESIDQGLDKTLARTNVGGSAFEARAVRSPADVPLAVITVIFRPFLFEAGNVAVLISAVEGSILIALTICASRWIWRIGPAMYREPFAAFCGAYVMGFVVAFSNIGNAGILSRQRVQMFPLLLLLACLARVQHQEEQAEAEIVEVAGHATEPHPVTPRSPAGAMPVPSPARLNRLLS
ncbi:MAG: hypothetical protein JWM47_1291 [Acidimicrobiales bacterium]|nr:hypothetical protein [Acidimicrobiales bacterium]